MFNEDEDWNDEREAQILSKTVLSNTKKTDGGTSVKLKVVGKSSLMRTLKTLGSVPEWKRDSHQEDSDEDSEDAPPRSKTKKKRRKKRKHVEEQQENGDQSLKEEKSAPKKRKKDDKAGSPKAKGTSSGEGMDKEVTKSALVKVNNPQNTERMSRKQWKNKMKNKRKCKNKYSQKQPEEEVSNAKSAGKHKPKEEVKNDLHSNNKSEKNSQKKKKDRKPLKKKHTEEETNEKKCIPAQKNVPESSADVSEQQTCERAVEVPANQQQSPTKRLKPEQSKAQTLKRQKLQRMLHSQDTEHHASPAEPKEEPTVSEEEVKRDRSASLRCRMEQRLEAARFRYINEVLYSTSSGEAKRMFKQDPQAFWIYHKGYTAQVQRWPANPVDAIISYIQKRPSSLVVADFGCGDCKIARSVKNRVHSFDLAATCELVTVCDMAHVPLDDSSVDIAVFCLSLMGTNLADFLAEANRVLKMEGVLKIAEVTSRFDNVRSFITALSTLGFKMVLKDTENSHFYSFEFVKMKKAPENVKKVGLQLKPCVYKKR
ncbi:ribosomal RNA-processing protein 8 [Archocentrus centrarchus]|uniref:ribosomal RNA-processing protein 8 n=1 Tax=Archocentrus centrarchus TaxID=63155 RepID=UPI0011E9D8AE|nr:ribosomal RNA-processing protein 8 [Archocentrus centrarchus]